MAISLQADSNLPQGYILVNGTAAATIRQDGALVVPSLSASGIRVTGTIVGNLSGNVTGNIVGSLSGIASQATTLATASASNAPVYGCRAWVNFDATRNASGGSDTLNTNRFIRSSGNVSSVLRNAQGTYSISFTVPMVDTNYSIAALGPGTVSTNHTLPFINTGSITTNNFTVEVFNPNNSTQRADPPVLCIQVFGN